MRLADAPDILTVPEAAQFARVGRNQMYLACARGDVWSARIGKSIRIPKVSLIAYLMPETKGAGSDRAELGNGVGLRKLPIPQTEALVEEAIDWPRSPMATS